MKKTTGIILSAALLMFSIPALASHCPEDMKRIDEELAASPPLTEEEMNTVKKLRAEGETLHKEGKHKESVEVLAKALVILKITPGPT